MNDLGPVQVLVVGFDDLEYNGEILAELGRLRERDIIRLVDLVVVEKDPSGDVTSIGMSDLRGGALEEPGGLAGTLIGLEADGEEGNEDEDEEEEEEDEEDKELAPAGAAELADGDMFDEEARWAIADAIPTGTTAAVALIEHRWAIPLRDAIRRAGGVPLADTWIHPEDLFAVVARQA